MLPISKVGCFSYYWYFSGGFYPPLCREDDYVLQIVICEDDKRYLQYVESTVEKVIDKNGIQGQIVCSADNPELVGEYIRNRTANVFLLDIDLKVPESGYMLAQKIRENDRKAYIVFISAHLEYILRAFKIKPFDFLPKPVTAEILEKCILDINNDILMVNDPGDEANILEIKAGPNLYRIRVSDIIYVEKLSFKTIIHMVNNEIYCYDTLESIENRLSGNNFVRCHKSFIANRHYISNINIKDKKVVFESGQFCFIGGKYKKGLMPDV